jgi:hypothetical protein
MLLTRLGIPAAIVWGLALLIRHWIAWSLAAVLTVGVLALIFWARRTAQRTQAVANIVQGANTPEARREAMAKLEARFKKDDTAAVFAKAQLQMQEDPRAALATLETIDLPKLEKLMAPLADQARAQRAMIHLVFGETDEARALVDGIDLSRHKEPLARATMVAVQGEAWARTGAAKKACELLETLDVQDPVYAELKPQLLRAKAFAYAWANNSSQMKATLRAMAAIQPQLLMRFVTKKKNPAGGASRGVHPLLEKEAFELLSRIQGGGRRIEYRRG